MPFIVPGIAGTFFAPGERRGNRTYVWRGFTPEPKEREATTDALDLEGAARFVIRYFARLERERVPEPGEQVTVARVVELYKEARNPSKADVKRLDRIVDAHGGRTIGSIGNADVSQLALKLDVGVATVTRNRETVTPYRTIINYAAENEWRPLAKIRSLTVGANEPPPERPHAEDATVKRYLKVAPPDVAAVIRIAHERGIRISEIVGNPQAPDTTGVRWENLDLAKRSAKVLIRKQGARWFEFRISRALAAALKRLGPKPEGRVFRFGNKSNFYKALEKLEKEHKRLKPKWRPHQSRRTIITEIIRDTGDKQEAANYVGQKSAASTGPYRVLTNVELAAQERRAVRRSRI